LTFLGSVLLFGSGVTLNSHNGSGEIVTFSFANEEKAMNKRASSSDARME
jgi:hypothetical protein